MGKTLSAEDVNELVAKAFTLEAITDKPGCTTRYSDLPGKPLQDFIIAGINSASYFSKLAVSLEKNPKTPIFKYNLGALKASNKHKSSKFLNFGLLEIMFPAVYARLKSNNPADIIDKIIENIHLTTNLDVLSVLHTRALAWSTSSTPHKLGFRPDKYKNLKSVWDFYMALNEDFEPDSSNFQWAEQYKKGLPILRAFFDSYTDNREIILTTNKVFQKQKQDNSQVALGILADMSAAAIFLWLSFNQGPVSAANN